MQPSKRFRTKNEVELRDEGFVADHTGHFCHEDGRKILREACGQNVSYDLKRSIYLFTGYGFANCAIDADQAWAVTEHYLH